MRHRSRASRPGRRSLLALMLWALGGWGCGSEPAQEEPTLRRTTFYPLSAWRDTTLRERSAQPPKTAWIQTPTDRLPAFYSFNDFDLEVPLEEPIGGLVRGFYGFTTGPRAPDSRAPDARAPDAQAPDARAPDARAPDARAPDARAPEKPARARFRILLRSPTGNREEVVHEAEFTGRSEYAFEEFSAPLPDVWQGAAFLRFEVRYLTPRRLRAAWLDPVVERLEPRSAPPEGAPNLLLITSDTTRQDILGVYGGPAETPRLEALAQDGVRFDNALSVAFGTTPSHTSLFTSSHPADHGVYDNATIVGEGLETLAEVLRAAGYTTAAFVSATPLINQLGIAQGFDHYDDLFLLDDASHLGRTARQQRRADLTIDRCLRWLDQQPPRPFFLWLHLFDPHQPYLKPPHEDGDPAEAVDDIEARFRAPNGNARAVYLDDTFDTDAQRQELARRARERYLGEIAFLDRQLGRLFDDLRGRGLYDGSVIAFLADHGETLDEHERVLAFRHQGLHGSVARIPLLLKLPEGRLAGTRKEFLLGNLDLAPTLVDLLGLEVPGQWTGRSFLRLLEQEAEATFRPHLVLEGSHQQEISVRTPGSMYREVLPEFHQHREVSAYLGYDPDHPVEFYDLEVDRKEQKDLAAAAPPELERLRSLGREFLSRRERANAETLESEEHRRGLEALGYVNN